MNNVFYKPSEEKIQRRQIWRMKEPRNLSPSSNLIRVPVRTFTKATSKRSGAPSDWKTFPTEIWRKLFSIIARKVSPYHHMFFKNEKADNFTFHRSALRHWPLMNDAHVQWRHEDLHFTPHTTVYRGSYRPLKCGKAVLKNTENDFDQSKKAESITTLNELAYNLKYHISFRKYFIAIWVRTTPWYIFCWPV